jgi:murein DD-endopeptidase MepM/ murein hydrolase activator NlpD
MPLEGGRRSKSPRQYILSMVPLGEGGKTRSIKLGPVKLVLFVLSGVVAISGLTVAVMVYTPIASLFPIPNPGLEQRYGRKIEETQEKLRVLAEEVLLLRDYNVQLRKALGEDMARNTSASRSYPLSQRPSGQAPANDIADVQNVRIDTVSAELHGDFDLMTSDYGTVPAEGIEFQAVFPLMPPTDGFISQEFDPTRNHLGIDFAARRGTPVYAATDGFVLFSGWTFEDGNMFIISHGGGYLTVYKHNQSLMKGAQTSVRRGELIARVGDSGRTSRGPHLHFEVWKDGVPLDPRDFLLTRPAIP